MKGKHNGATTFKITTLSTIGLFATLSINDNLHNVFSVIMLSAITLNFVMPSPAIMLRVVILSVVARGSSTTAHFTAHIKVVVNLNQKKNQKGYLHTGKSKNRWLGC